jgi:hypothetical protein
VKRSILILLGFIGLSLVLSCGKSSEKVVIEGPQHATPGNPFFVSEEEVDGDDILTPTEVDKDYPCYQYLKNKVVRPVASCTELENGRIKDTYKNKIHAGGLCLLRKSFPSGLNLYTLVGIVSESKKDEPRLNIKIDIFGESEKKDQDQDLLRFQMKGETKSTVKYSLSENSVTVRTVSKLWKKRLRYYRLACKQINPIVD